MGQRVDKDRYSEAEFARFGERLAEQLAQLHELLARPGFGTGPTTIGAELELFLTTPDGHPFPRNHEVRDAADDDRLTLELGRFNLEANLTPLPLPGRPFTALEREVREVVAKVDAAAATQGGRAVAIGILPTLGELDFTHETMSDESRYRALSRGMRRLRVEPFRVRIHGVEKLELEVQGVILESANTSWQIHLRTPPPTSPASTTPPSWPWARSWRPAGTPRSSWAGGCGRRPGSPCSRSRPTTATWSGSGAGTGGWPSAPAG
nr:hypothetical protein GCM10020093_035330 [Planobispora longispora]